MRIRSQFHNLSLLMLFLAATAGISLYRWGVRFATGQGFANDAEVWVSVGTRVLDGAALYAQVPDNKPPLWEFIAILAAATPIPHLVLLMVTGLGSGLLVWFTFRFLSRYVDPRSAALSAAFSALVIFRFTNGFTNNKTLALALIMAGLLTMAAPQKGILYGASIMIAQQLVLAAPALIWWEYRRGQSSRIYTMLLCMGGVVMISYLLVAGIWGLGPLVAAVEQTVLVVPAYAVSASQFQTGGSFAANPDRYISLFFQRSEVYLPHIIFSAFSLARLADPDFDAVRVTYLGFLLAGSLSISLFVRMYRHYWLLLLPGLSILAAMGIDWLISARA